MIIESALGRTEVDDEINGLDKAYGCGGACEAVALSFFAADHSGSALSESRPNFLGQATVINYRKPGNSAFDLSYIFEAILPIPSQPSTNGSVQLLNNYVGVEGTFQRTVDGQTLGCKGVFYAQQNGVTNVCAHACLRMVLNTLDCSNPVTATKINGLLGLQDSAAGLTIGQIVQVLEHEGKHASLIDCEKLSPQIFVSTLAAIVRSGYCALVVFTTAKTNEEHVVLAFGHTRNSDQWHPQAIPAYQHSPAPFIPSSSWVSHFLIHDDNFGPYYTLSSRALDLSSDVKAHWILGVMDVAPAFGPQAAEAAAALVLNINLPSLAPIGKSKWFTYMTGIRRELVLRTILLTRQNYLKHIEASQGHDRSKASAEDIKLLTSLPELMWMVEFTLAPLYTGNRSKLGEVLLNAKEDPQKGLYTILAGIRLPGLFLQIDNVSFQAEARAISLDSHCPIYRPREHANEW